MVSVNDFKLNALRAKYKCNLGEYKTRLTELWLKENKDPAILQEIQTIAHRLAGSGQAYGFKDISQDAKELERALDEPYQYSQIAADETISRPLLALLETLKKHESTEGAISKKTTDPDTSAESSESHNAINLLIVDDDVDFSTQLAHTLEAYGYRAHIEQDIARLEDAIARYEPLALIVDMDFYGQRYAGSNHVSLWRQQDGAPLPVIFISEHDSFDLRLAAIRASGNHFFNKPLNINKLIALLRGELNLSPAEQYRVMIVDDDSDLLILYESILTDKGYAVTTATDAQSTLNLINQSQPELILIDVNMPRCNGIELGRIIRQHEEYSIIPLLFISASADTDMQLACARLANDEFINKPIEPWRLLMMVKSRVVKGRQLRMQDLSIYDTEISRLPDDLTGLPKLAYLRRTIDSALQKKQQNLIALIKMDIRDFHSINNLHGQFFGDQVLQRIAWELGQHIQSGTLLCRGSGDEFLILCDVHDSQEALTQYIHQLVKIIDALDVSSPHGPAALSVSVGVSIATSDTKNADELIDYADMALFKAKAANGPELVFFDKSLQIDQKQRFNMEQQIKKGLQNGEFVAAYQPIFSVEKQNIVGFEALARWQHPERGILGPGEFISLMEEIGLISQLTEQMLRHVCHQLSCWKKQYPAIFISLNLSARDIHKPIFISQLQSLIKQHELIPERVILEITESLLLSDWQKASPVLESLRATGVRLALDDFGTGYSSLSYLHRINADKLKIDRSFIEHWSRTGDSRLLRAMVQLGKSMEMKVIAEGIEKTEELQFLKDIGCDQYQGFLSARPMLIEEIVGGNWLPPSDYG